MGTSDFATDRRGGLRRRRWLTAPLLRFALVSGGGLAASAALLALIYAQGGSIRGFTFLSGWQMAIGLCALLIAGSMWALRPGDLATRLFLASGVATLAFTFAPVPDTVTGFTASNSIAIGLGHLNGIGAVAFGIAMIGLFLIYPVRLKLWPWIAAAVLIVFGGWAAAALTLNPPGSVALHRITLAEMAGIFAALAAQYVAARGDPKARAILIWLGGSVALGAGAFIALVALPSSLGYRSVVDARLAFGFFLIIYLGCAAGLGRYRLFELGDWAFRALFYFVAAVLLIALDALLILFLPLDPGPALGISILVIAFAYLPFRETLGRAILRRTTLADRDVFRAVMETAFEVSPEARAGQWRQILGRLFEPLEILTLPGEASSGSVEVRDDGMEMRLPAIADSRALRLRYPWKGQGLFGPRHLKMAEELCALMRHADASRAAYDRGVSEERSRIARDMHDNIGAQLLGALHSPDSARKDLMIRETLTDLRDIINNTSPAGMALINLIADLRAETGERLAAAGMRLDWTADIEPGTELTPAALHALRSVVRESVSNALRHSGGSRIGLSLASRDGQLILHLADDGHGFDPQAAQRGNGLGNMHTRMAGLKGTIEVESGPGGTQITARFPAGTVIPGETA